MASVDVVVLSWNRLVPTLETLDNLLAQESVDLSIWLVDQGSAEETLAALRGRAAKDPRIHLIELASNVGVAAGRNIGMRAGKGEAIACIDNDAVFGSPQALSETVARFNERPELGALGFRIEDFSSGKLDLDSWVYPKALLSKSDQTFLATRFCGAGHAIRRSALEKTRGYDERLFFYWEELDLSYQFIQLGYEIGYQPTIVVRHKTSPQARTKWSEDRYYYLVRNALFLDWKYFRSITSLVARAGGYILKGLYNRVLGQAARGLRDALGMIKKLGLVHHYKLGPQAINYVRLHDLKVRGGVWKRIRQEVFVPLSNPPK